VDIIVVDLNVTPLVFVEHIYRTIKTLTEKQITVVLISSLMTWFKTATEKENKNYMQRIATSNSDDDDKDDKDDKNKEKFKLN